MIPSLRKIMAIASLSCAVSVVSCATKQEEVSYQPTEPAEVPSYVDSSDSDIMMGSLEDFVVNVGDRIYFDTDRYDLNSRARDLLDKQANWLKRHHDGMVLIEGNCDERGTREYNLALGARRASAVRDYLVSRGVSPAKLETISYGKERPIDARSTADAWQRNRNAHTALVGVNS